MRRYALICLTPMILVVLAGVYYQHTRDPEFEIFREQQAMWHRACDESVRQPAARRTAHARACVQRWTTLMVYAEKKGWRARLQ